jgi:uncharacterized membrane protein YebE (DUF533 family)
MTQLADLKARLLADGKIDDEEVAVIRKELYADGTIDKEEVEFLTAVRNEAREVCPAFETLFFEAVKSQVLTDGSIDADEVTWLRKMLFADGKVDAAEKKFFAELKSSARSTCPEFQTLADEVARG